MQSFWKLLRYIRNYRFNVAMNILCNLLMAIFTAVSIPAVIPFLQILFDQEPAVTEKPAIHSMGDVVAYGKYIFSNSIETNGKEGTLVYVCIIIVVLYLLINLFRYFSLFFMAPVRNGIVRDIRAQLFDKLMALPLSYFSEERKGDLLSRITADVQEVEWSILNVLEAIFREPIIIVLCLGTMIYISPTLTIFVFVLLVFTTVIIGGIGKTLKRQSSVVQQQLGQLVTIIEEALSGLRIIKGFNAEGYQQNKFAEVNNAYRWNLTRVLWRRDLSSPLSEFLGVTIVAILLWFASKQVFAGTLEPATLFAYLLAFFYILNPAKSFSSAYYNIQKGLAAMERIEHVLEADLGIVEKKDAKRITTLEQEIVFESVSFWYKKGEQQILNNITLHLPKGKVIALVGASGAGKSTMADLLPRFYEVEKGAILIDGINIKDYRLTDLRALMGIVSQEAILFNDSIYNNIVFGLKDVTEAEVIQAAKVANAHEFILATEEGYQTNIGDRGGKLSGGQRQRITIARAVLKNPPILILDEATSALDSESERLVQDALLKLMKNRTSLVIAHRLSTIQHADEIVVMDAGRIIERGTHEQLLSQNGAYRRLVDLQGF